MKIDKLLTKGQILWLTHIGALIPLAWLLFDQFTNNLSVNPIQDWTLRTGKPALVLIVLSLSCTPLNIVLGWRNIIPARKWLGLYAFGYAAIHFVIFIYLDYGLQWIYIWQDVGTKLYVIVGFSALLILLPLALTSTKGWMRRLGKRWKKLHQWVYVAGVLAVFHYVWVVKADYREPAAWGVLLGFFLLVRIPVVRKRIARMRSKPRSPSGPRARRSPA
jgi:sulfoxide reductase heme-binding subunit YedZ